MVLPSGEIAALLAFGMGSLVGKPPADRHGEELRVTRGVDLARRGEQDGLCRRA